MMSTGSLGLPSARLHDIKRNETDAADGADNGQELGERVISKPLSRKATARIAYHSSTAVDEAISANHQN